MSMSARRGRIGIVLQSFHLLPTMTALENVAVPLELAGEGTKEERLKRAREALERVMQGMSDHKEGIGRRLDAVEATLRKRNEQGPQPHRVSLRAVKGTGEMDDG